MSAPVHFSLSKRQLIFLGVLLCVSALLFFSAGLVAGLLLPSVQAARGSSSVGSNRQKKPELAAVRTIAVARNSPPRASVGPPRVGPGSSQLTLQVASFEDSARAQSFSDSLKRAGFPVLAGGTMQLGDTKWHTVLVGPYNNWDEAAKEAADLQHSYNVDVYVRVH